jgi:hypothetical protein
MHTDSPYSAHRATHVPNLRVVVVCSVVIAMGLLVAMLGSRGM